MKRAYPRLALLAAVALAAGGCAMPPKPIDFNKRLVGWNAELNDASQTFARALQNPTDKFGLESAFANMEDTLAVVREEYEDSTHPVGSSAGEDLYEFYGDYLDAQEGILNRYRTCMELALVKPADPRIQQELAEIRKEEIKAYAVVQSAQSAFAKEHNFQVQGGM